MIVDALRRCAPMALAAGLLAAPLAESARFGLETVANAPVPRVVPPALERRIAEARATGFWIVDEGEHLHGIARLLAATDEEGLALERSIAQLNAIAVVDISRTALTVGSRLALRAPAVAAPKPAAPLPEVVSKPDAPSIAATVASAATATPSAAAAPYVDRLIGGAREDSEEPGGSVLVMDERPGLRNWAVELRSETRDVSSAGRASSEGLTARYAQETERYGDFALLVQAAHVRPAPGDPLREQTRGTATLFQDNFALSPDLVANSALGVIRPTLPPWLSTSYRVSLTPPLIEGFSTVIASSDRELRLSAGGIGEYASFGVQQFQRLPGESISATYSQRLPGEWLAGATAIAVRGQAASPDRSTVSVAVQDGFQRSIEGVKVQAAITDDGERAAWIDALKRSGRFTHRFGAFQVDPDFIFGPSQSLRDSRGAYWRGDYRAAGNFYGAGVEWSQDNLRRDPARGGSDNASAFGNVVLRLDRAMQVGGGASIRSERARTPTGSSREVYGENLFISRNGVLGTTRLDATGTQSRPESGSTEHSAVYNWNQDWNAFPQVSINTLASFSDESLNDRRVKRRTLSIGARGPLYGVVNWDASVTLVDARSTAGDERNYNTALSLDWNPVRSWMLQLGWYRNVIQPGPDNSLAPFRRENVVQLNVRYEDTAGSPFPRVGGLSGRSGSGSVAGSVFYDENADRRRGANERGAANVVVILDERQSATTDADGRFKFSLVPSGRHRIRVLVDRVALPWGLEDDSPREVEVDIRADAKLDVPLTRISP